MRNKSAVLFFSAILTILCIFYLSFTYVSQKIENDAVAYALGKDGKVISSKKQAYIDSIRNEPVFLNTFTFQQVKELALHLGLDLQGGMNLTLEVSPVAIIKGLSGNSAEPAFLAALKKADQQKNNSRQSFITLFYDAYREANPNKKLSEIFSNSATKGRISYDSSDQEVLRFLEQEMNDAVDRAFDIIRSRIDKFGVVQPNIQQLQGTGRIQIELPGVDDPERVRKLVQGMAKLEFFEVHELQEVSPYLQAINTMLMAKNKTASTNAKGSTPTATDTLKTAGNVATDSTTTAADTIGKSLEDQLASGADTSASAVQKNLQASASPLFSLVKSPYGLVYDIKDTATIGDIFRMKEVRDLLPATVEPAWAHKPVAGTDGSQLLELNLLKENRGGKAILTGEVISDARQDLSQSGRGYEISMKMNAEGARRWKQVTGQNIGKRIAIVLDHSVYSAPTVQGEIPNGNSSISGNFTLEEAKDLANILKTGKLPAPTTIVEEAVVGPSLGKEAINQGLLSIGIGFLIVIVFMYLIYNQAGWVADVAVIANLFFLAGILASLGAALTLPGIAGILLTIGMAVDANVLINERVKEELELGRTLRTAIDNGYKNAFSAIMDSNITTLIAGVVLLVFGTGLIYGFAVTLIIGIVCSLFTSILLTRLIFEYMLDKNKSIRFSNQGTKNLLRHVHIDFIGKRKYYYLVSSIIILAGVVSMTLTGLNYGVDFKGGRTYIVQFENPTTSTDVRNVLASAFGSAPEVKTYGSDHKFKITTIYLIDQDSDQAVTNAETKLNEGLAKITGNKAEIVSSSKVGPTIANDIKVSALYSVIAAMIGMFIYILIRFRKWEFALGTVIKLVHDVLVVLAIFSLLQNVMPFLEIDQAFIAAILTVIGYSINDSVVVLDRVREFLGTHNNTNNISTVINNALNDTLSRTIITGMTTFFVIFVLFIFGGEVLRGFSFAMLLGIVVGTYSSLCIGAPLVLDLAKSKSVDTPAKATI